jgi:hypothetical protein
MTCNFCGDCPACAALIAEENALGDAYGDNAFTGSVNQIAEACKAALPGLRTSTLEADRQIYRLVCDLLDEIDMLRENADPDGDLRRAALDCKGRP